MQIKIFFFSFPPEGKVQHRDFLINEWLPPVLNIIFFWLHSHMCLFLILVMISEKL